MAAETYTLDPMHTAVCFKIPHLGLSWSYGRFNEMSGKFTVDGNGGFMLNIKPESIDTGNAKRDEHLRSPDFLNVKQFPALSFTSTQVKPIDGGFEVAGDLTMHGETHPVSMVLKGDARRQFPAGVKRTGYSTEVTLHRKDFGMDKMLEAVGDEVRIMISFEGVQQ